MTTPNHPPVVCEMVAGLGHEQCPRDYRARDPELARVTEGSLMGSLIRLVGRFEPSDQTWERTRSSCQINKYLELGWAHLSTVGNVARFLNALATELPDVAVYAWGDNGTQFQQYGYAQAFCEQFVGLTSLPAGADWFVAGWYQIAPRPDVQRLYTRQWWDQHGVRVVSWMQANGYDSGRLLATGVRASNSGKFDDAAHSTRSLKHLVAQYGPEEGLTAFWRNVWEADNDTWRLNAVKSWPEFQTKVTRWPDPSDLDWGSSTIWPELSGAVATSSGAPSVSGTTGSTTKWIEWAAGAAVGAALLGGIGWLVFGRPKRKRRRRRR